MKLVAMICQRKNETITREKKTETMIFLKKNKSRTRETKNRNHDIHFSDFGFVFLCQDHDLYFFFM